MIKTSLSLVVAILLLMPQLALAQQDADLVILNANVVTVDPQNPRAQAVAIKGNKISAVGTIKAISKFIGTQTKTIDAQGKTIIPGLYDSHLHVIRAGRFYNSELRWDGVKTLSRALSMLKEQAARTPEGKWVRVVGGWSEFQFAEKRLPTLEEINSATGNTPTFILHLYGQAFLNKAALQLLGINADSPNPIGGLIQKDSAGNPTGLLIAEPNAFILYSTLAKLPELSREEQLNSTQLFIKELNSFGVTSVMDAGGGFQNFPEDYAIMDELTKNNALTVRIPYYLFAQRPGAELADYGKWMAKIDIDDFDPNQEIDYRVQGGGENLVSAAGDFENFTKPRPELSQAMDEQLTNVITLLVKNKWPFRLHATYNESISRFLAIIEKVNQQTPLNGLNWFFDHAETISEANLQRTKALGGGIAIQHRMAYQAENFIARYGKKAAENAPPLRKMIELGLKVGAGTDGTRVASYNPWVAIYWLTTGKSVGGTLIASKENQLSRLEALRLFTQGSASLINQQTDRGMIKAGYLADVALLSADLMQVEAEQLKDMRAELTIVNGKVVFAAQSFHQYSPSILKAIPAWSPINFYGGYQYK